MELTSVAGIIVGIIAVVGAMIFKHISFSVFINPAAIFVILVGSVACILNAFPGKDLKSLGKLFKILFTTDSSAANRKVEIIKTLVELSSIAHHEGILALEDKTEAISDPFLKKAIEMAVDGVEYDYMVEALGTEMSEIEERHNLNASIFTQAGTYAPTLGVLGAVFGLIAAMGSIEDTAAMAEAIAAAFIATILGIFTGYVLWNPFANKLKVKNKHEMVEKRMIMEGVVEIQKGVPPVMIKNKLTSFLSDSEKSLMADGGKEEEQQ